MNPINYIFYLLLFSVILSCTTIKTRDLRVVQVCGTKDFDLIKIDEISGESRAGKLISKNREYEVLLGEMEKEEVTEELKKIIENTGERMKTIQEGVRASLERRGDEYYNRYEFGKAIESYLDARNYLSNREGNDKFIEGLNKKIRLSRETGEGYLENKVRGYVDQALLLNLEGNKIDAKKSIDLAKNEMDTSIFVVQKAIDAYNEATDILKVSKYVADADCMESGKLAKINPGSVVQSGRVYTNSIGMEFIEIPAGSFEMGCVGGFLFFGDTDCEDDEKPRHRVNLTKQFYLGKFEVTQGQWRAVMGNNPSSFSKCGDNCPVENVSWNDVQEYIRRLNAKEGGSKYRLPTEAEWEYAARAGTSTTYYWGNWMDGDYAWYYGNSGVQTHPVGQKKPNAWGLYDMTGNVWEWTQDWYDGNYYGKSPSNNPSGAESGGHRLMLST